MQTIKTSPRYLGKYIKCFYSIIESAGQDVEMAHRRLPEGTLDMVVDLGDPVTLSGDELNFDNMPNVAITGLYPSRRFHQYKGRVHLVGAVFQPGYAHLFVNDDLEQFKASTIEATNVFGNNVKELPEQLNAIPSETQKHHFLEQFLIKRIRLNKIDHHSNRIFQAVQHIHAHNGNVDIHSLQQESLMSERSFRRTFSEYVGMSPKQYTRIIRIKSFSKRCESSNLAYSHILYEFGYSDPAHFSKDFQKIAGTTARAYFNQLNPITEQYIHLI